MPGPEGGRGHFRKRSSPRKVLKRVPQRLGLPVVSSDLDVGSLPGYKVLSYAFPSGTLRKPQSQPLSLPFPKENRAQREETGLLGS